MDNIIVKLIEAKMDKDKWDARTPDSYASYLFNLSDDEIIEEVKKQ